MSGLWDYDDEDTPLANEQAPDTPASATVVNDSSVEDSVPSKGNKKRGRKDSRKLQSTGKKVVQQLDLGHNQRAFKPEPQVIVLSDDEDEPTGPSKSPQQQQQPSRATRGSTKASIQSPKNKATKATTAAETAPITSDAQLKELCPQTREMLESARRLTEAWQEMKGQHVTGYDNGPLTEPAPKPAPRTSQLLLRPLPLQPSQVQAQPIEEQPTVLADGGIQGTGASAEGLVTAGSNGGAVGDENKLLVILKHKQGEARVKIKSSDTVSKLLQAFLHVAQGKTEWCCPTDVAAYKLDFDGTRLAPDKLIKDTEIDDGDVVDVLWK